LSSAFQADLQATAAVRAESRERLDAAERKARARADRFNPDLEVACDLERRVIAALGVSQLPREPSDTTVAVPGDLVSAQAEWSAAVESGTRIVAAVEAERAAERSKLRYRLTGKSSVEVPRRLWEELDRMDAIAEAAHMLRDDYVESITRVPQLGSRIVRESGR